MCELNFVSESWDFHDLALFCLQITTFVVIGRFMIKIRYLSQTKINTMNISQIQYIYHSLDVKLKAHACSINIKT